MTKLVILLFLVLGLQYSQATMKLYWANSSSQYFGISNLDGSGENNTFIQANSEPSDIFYNTTNNKFYYVDAWYNKIGRANSDGSGNNNDFIDLGGNSWEGALSLVIVNDVIYFTMRNSGDIGKVNIDGTGLNKSFIAGANAQGLAYAGGYLYWTTNQDFVLRANIDGTGIITLMMWDPYLNSSFKIYVDQTNSYIFIGNRFGWTVRYNLSGAYVSTITTLNTNAICSDETNGYLYYALKGSPSSIIRSALDGSGAITVISDVHDCWSVRVANVIAGTITLTTTSISNIQNTSASGGGNISSDGGANITARGIIYGTSGNPELSGASTTTTDGTGTGSFTSNLSGLSPGTFYYVKAYATNANGTSLGNQVTFTTIPTLPEWGLIAMSIIFLGFGAWYIFNRN